MALMENTSDYSVFQMNSWSDFKNFVSKFSENWAFRGQVDPGWALRTAIERTDFIRYYNGIENVFVTEFQRGARNFLNKNETPEHIIEWLALMQHHGAPTRLLDLTKSPFISAYFAYEQCDQSTASVAIWGMNVNYLRKAAVDFLRPHFEADFEKSNNEITEEIFEKIYKMNELNVVFPIEPFRMNQRYSQQQSLFLSTGNASEPFMEQLKFLGESAASSVVRIEVPTCLQKEALRDLQKMNIHRASLFPDLDGYANSLRIKYNSMKTAEEALEHKIALLDDENFKLLP